MHKGTVLNLKKFNSGINFVRKNWCVLILTVAFIIGIFIGTYGITKYDILIRFTEKLTENFIIIRCTDKFFSIFLNAFITNFIFLLLIFVFGTSVTGITLVPIIVGIKGFSLGSIISVVYSQYALKGIAFNALIIIPPSVVTIIFIILFAKNAINLSLQIINITLPDSKPKNLSFGFKQYFNSFLLVLIPIIFTSILDAWLSVNFISYLDF